MKPSLLLLLLHAPLLLLHAQEVWNDARTPLTDLLELRDEKDTLPRRRLIGRDHAHVNKDMDRIKTRLLDVLEQSELTRLRTEYDSLGARADTIKATIRELREAKLTAPAERELTTFLHATQSDLDKKITDNEETLREIERRRNDIVNEMVTAYANLGLTLTRPQVQFYLSSVSGDDLMAMSTLFHHTREINAQLETLIRADPADLPSARRYYGVHVVLLETLMHAHEIMIGKIDTQYLPDLSALEEENERLIRDTNNLLDRTPPEQQDQLLRNRQLQDLTAETLAVYRRHLDQVRGQIEQSLKAVSLRHEIADNSYATLRVSSALAEQIEQVLKDLGTLQSLHLPPLLPFNNEILEQKFQEITRELER